MKSESSSKHQQGGSFFCICAERSNTFQHLLTCFQPGFASPFFKEAGRFFKTTSCVVALPLSYPRKGAGFEPATLTVL